MISGAIYGLCALAALLCGLLLLQAYRRGGYKLLLWSGLCFVGLTLTNFLLVIDKLIVPYADLSMWRSLTSLLSLVVLLYGLIWDTK